MSTMFHSTDIPLVGHRPGDYPFEDELSLGYLLLYRLLAIADVLAHQTFGLPCLPLPDGRQHPEMLVPHCHRRPAHIDDLSKD